MDENSHTLENLLESSIVSTSFQTDADRQENILRPKLLADFQGQARLKENLAVFIKAARGRGEALDHTFLIGPPGLGKTTLASIIANEMEAEIRMTSAPALDKPKDLAGILTNVTEGSIFFIDEIHRLKPALEEMLYIAMEDFEIDWVIGQGPAARTMRIPLPHFTLVGATTKAGSVSSPLASRFGITAHIEFYNEEELSQIIERSAVIMEVEIEEDAIRQLARCSRGTPRIANRLLRRLRDFASIIGDGHITVEVVEFGLGRLGIDEMGLERQDRNILRTIIEFYDGGPVGAETLSISVGEAIESLEDFYEPYLIQKGFLKRTPRGRMATKFAYELLNIPAQGTSMTIKEFSFDLPEHLIAQYPTQKRGEERLLVLDRNSGAIVDEMMAHFSDYLSEGSLLVVNNSKVRKARVYATGEGGGTVEFLFLEELLDHSWLVMTTKAKKQRVGKRYRFEDEEGVWRREATIVAEHEDGTRTLRFDEVIDEGFFSTLGHVPLPPYIKREDTLSDESRYQTIYAKNEGSVASPTAGLHFTAEILEAIKRRGIEIAEVTLHVGPGTFLPVRAATLEEHRMHWERYEVSEHCAHLVTEAKRSGRPVVAVGTTSVRTLESAWDREAGLLRPGVGRTNLFIMPGFRFQVVDQLLTNFHTPESTLVVLVSAFAGREAIGRSYRHAVEQSYRFFSYGDAMFIR